MYTYYDKIYLENTLWSLNSALKDLQVWSISNGDQKLEEINQIEALVDLLTKQLTK
jgi:hypothetical protein